MKPIDTAMYWIEYVIRNKETSHLKSVGLNVSWYQYLYLDVITLLVTLFVFVYFILALCLKTFKQSNVVKKNNKND